MIHSVWRQFSDDFYWLAAGCSARRWGSDGEASVFLSSRRSQVLHFGSGAHFPFLYHKNVAKTSVKSELCAWRDWAVTAAWHTDARAYYITDHEQVVSGESVTVTDWLRSAGKSSNSAGTDFRNWVESARYGSICTSFFPVLFQIFVQVVVFRLARWHIVKARANIHWAVGKAGWSDWAYWFSLTFATDTPASLGAT